MKLARYHEENLGHFGLATPSYCPLHEPDPALSRPGRPPLAARAAQRPPADATRGLPAPLPEMGRHLSEMERRATDAERELIEWKKVRFMADKVGETYTGYVTGVQAFGLFVELEEIYVQGLVHVSSMTDDYYRFDERGHALRGENTGKVYRLGDRAYVQVARVDLERRQIEFALVDVLGRPASARGGRRGAAGRERERPSGRGRTSRTPAPGDARPLRRRPARGPRRAARPTPPPALTGPRLRNLADV